MRQDSEIDASLKQKAIFIGVVVLVIAIVIVATTGVSHQSSDKASSASPNKSALELLSGSPPSLGSDHAPVTIVEFGDFQCPTCASWFKTQESKIVKELVETGKAGLIWKDFAFYGKDSTYAAEGAYAAREQGKFWQFHDLLYSKQQEPNDGWAKRDNLEGFAKQLGLNMAKFDESFNSGKYLSLIESNFQLGLKFGVKGTPTFFVVGSSGKSIMIEGAQPFSVFERAVNSVSG